MNEYGNMSCDHMKVQVSGFGVDGTRGLRSETQVIVYMYVSNFLLIFENIQTLIFNLYWASDFFTLLKSVNG
jgi:hypothetical protein